MNKNNLLVQAGGIYIECDYIKTALKALGNLTYCVAMPFLNCVERCDQNQLVEIIPKLHQDLENNIFIWISLQPLHVPLAILTHLYLMKCA